MESSNKALMMAFGMIVGVMIMAAIAFVFSNLKIFPEDEDSRDTVEQLAAFNREYEVYDKNIMYGVDVISVLNKAQSNNEKYALGNFLSGTGKNTDYIIDIEVILHKALEENLTVTFLENTFNGVIEDTYTNGSGASSVNVNEVFDMPSQIYRDTIYNAENFFWDDDLKTNTNIQTKVIGNLIGNEKGTTYHLLGLNPDNPGEYTNEMIEANSVLKTLLEQSTNMIKTVKNHGSNKFVEYNPDYNVAIPDSKYTASTGWNSATWYPAIYDFKQRKFKCLGDQIVYSEKTGRIIKMTFEEIL